MISEVQKTLIRNWISQFTATECGILLSFLLLGHDTAINFMKEEVEARFTELAK